MERVFRVLWRTRRVWSSTWFVFVLALICTFPLPWLVCMFPWMKEGIVCAQKPIEDFPKHPYEILLWCLYITWSAVWGGMTPYWAMCLGIFSRTLPHRIRRHRFRNNKIDLQHRFPQTRTFWNEYRKLEHERERYIKERFSEPPIHSIILSYFKLE